MASRQDSLQLMLSCVVCLEEFEDSGGHIPRLLPCTHTLCEACVKQLIRNQKLECPECRAKHDTKNEEKSFPQNKYLLMQIKRKPTEAREWKEERNEKEFCKEHGKELVLFCNEPGCQKPVCPLCLKKYHRRHDVTDIEDEMREVLMKKITFFEKNLKEKIVKLNDTKNDVNRKTEVCLNDLEKRRDEIRNEIEKQFDQMKKEAEDHQREQIIFVDNEIDALNENLNLLSSIKLDTEKDNSYNDLTDKLDTVLGLKETVNEHLSGERMYEYTKFSCTIFTPMYFGKIEYKQFSTKLSEIDEGAELVERSLRNIMELKCTVAKSFDADAETLGSIRLLADGSLVFSGKKQNQPKLQQYNLHTGVEMNCVDVPEACGLSAVELQGRSSLALSFYEKGVIEFRDQNNLDNILYTYSVAPQKPALLCPVSRSVLLYLCGTVVKPELRWLDCSTNPPKENSQKNIIFPAKAIFRGICFVNEETNRKPLVIISSRGPGGIHAYNVDTKSLEWKKEIDGMEQAGIVSDRHGHLFVCDWQNKCIHILSVSDGQYMGCLMKSGEQGLGIPYFIAWSEEMSSLIVANWKEINKWYISVIKVQ